MHAVLGRFTMLRSGRGHMASKCIAARGNVVE